ncbi:hypothetical protein GUJ93_ZPchr0010g9408 [Zizania palustris]|uniref:Uncharacterized protein n=1 Tax=Zizania palustris TaxID=103762 RepID=A0A8J5W8G6_ZIZPA|nr:hypothetical protein GUJ93_ZPchr0010g9408 [Zizania palustris]
MKPHDGQWFCCRADEPGDQHPDLLRQVPPPHAQYCSYLRRAWPNEEKTGRPLQVSLARGNSSGGRLQVRACGETQGMASSFSGNTPRIQRGAAKASLRRKWR